MGHSALGATISSTTLMMLLLLCMLCCALVNDMVQGPHYAAVHAL